MRVYFYYLSLFMFFFQFFSRNRKRYARRGLNAVQATKRNCHKLQYTKYAHEVLADGVVCVNNVIKCWLSFHGE